LAPGGGSGLLLALPGLIAIPVLSLFPALTEEYLPLSRAVSRGTQSSRNMVLMFMSMLAMAAVLIMSYAAWVFEIIWYVVAIEVIAGSVVYYFLNRVIKSRPLVRTYDDLFSYGRRET